MDFIKDIVENVWIQRAFWSVIVILFALLLYHIAARFLNSREKKNSKIMANKKNKTFIIIII